MPATLRDQLTLDRDQDQLPVPHDPRVVAVSMVGGGAIAMAWGGAAPRVCGAAAGVRWR
ncbi:hypothetical protein LUW77_00675 [Streptomyces radiopugnans]|nr:hypothetical protein LUW77_00675 [Streptomyces radiopugnans]